MALVFRFTVLSVTWDILLVPSACGFVPARSAGGADDHHEGVGAGAVPRIPDPEGGRVDLQK